MSAEVLVVVCAALLDAEGRVLLAERPAGKPMAGLWEFPGGKLQDGESPEAALVRELAEELGIEVGADALAPCAFASHAYATFHVLLLLYLCRQWRGDVSSREGQALAWVAADAIAGYAMPAADEPLVAALRRELR
jgi:8-oxo-dGTP diphosphatase